MTQVSLSELIAGARAGQVVSFPTDTVPALAVQPEGSELIFRAKNRRLDKPLILMGANLESLWPFCEGTEAEREIWVQVARKYWPGMVTLVLPASGRVPRQMNPLDPTTIGLRIPDCAIAQSILVQTGPLATTSANLSGQPPLETLGEIDAQFPQVLTLDEREIPAPLIPSGIPSTVVQWRGHTWKILRQGAVTLGED